MNNKKLEPEEIHAVMSRLGMAWITVDRRIEAAELAGDEGSDEDKAFRNSYHASLSIWSDRCYRLGWGQIVRKLAEAVKKLGRHPNWKDGVR